MRKPVYAICEQQRRSLISAFVVHCLDSIIPLVSISKLLSLYLASVAAQAGMCLTWSQIPKTGLLVTWLKWSKVFRQTGLGKQTVQGLHCLPSCGKHTVQGLHCLPSCLNVWTISIIIIEPLHDKTNKMTVPPAKTQISLGNCPVWSESSQSAQWVAKDSSVLHADSEDSDQTGMPRLIWVFAERTCYFVGFVMRRLVCLVLWEPLCQVYYIWAGPWENVSYVICEQQRRRSDCAFAQSDQRLCCWLFR